MLPFSPRPTRQSRSSPQTIPALFFAAATSLTAFVWGALYGGLFIVLMVLGGILWLFAGFLAGLGLRWKPRANQMLFLVLGTVSVFAILEFKWRAGCQAPRCQTTLLSDDVVWFGIGLVALGAGMAGLWLLRSLSKGTFPSSKLARGLLLCSSLLVLAFLLVLLAGDLGWPSRPRANTFTNGQTNVILTQPSATSTP